MKISDLIFRVCFSLIFVVSGIMHLIKPAQISQRLLAAPGAHLVPAWLPLDWLVMVTGLILLTGGLMLLLGIQIRKVAWTLIAVLIPITLTVQVGSAETLGPLFKNIALLGGLIHFAYSPEVSPSFRRAPALALGLLPLMAALGFMTQPGTGNAVQAMAHAQPITNQHNQAPLKVVFLVREPNHLKAALQTSAELLSGQGDLKAEAAEIIVCGAKGIESLKSGSPQTEALLKAKRQGIQVVACGLSLKELGLSPSVLMPGTTVIENGLIESIRLQRAGYLSVEL